MAGVGRLSTREFKSRYTGTAFYPLVVHIGAHGMDSRGNYKALQVTPWEFHLLARRSKERLDQNKRGYSRNRSTITSSPSRSSGNKGRHCTRSMASTPRWIPSALRLAAGSARYAWTASGRQWKWAVFSVPCHRMTGRART